MRYGMSSSEVFDNGEVKEIDTLCAPLHRVWLNRFRA